MTTEPSAAMKVSVKTIYVDQLINAARQLIQNTIRPEPAWQFQDTGRPMLAVLEEDMQWLKEALGDVEIPEATDDRPAERGDVGHPATQGDRTCTS